MTISLKSATNIQKASENFTSEANSKPGDISYQLVLCSCPDEATAINIAENIVAQRLAACVNILPESYSIYHWQGNVESAKEHMMLIKTLQSHYPSLEKVITSLHPYDVPEIISIDINSGLPHYLKWIESSIT
jgi:periplasmic divalent cation tolerance protein